MRYDEARSSIENGDLIAVRRKTGLFANLIRLVSGTEYTHVALAVWSENRLFAAGMLGSGDCLVPLSQYAETDFDIFPCPSDHVLAYQSTFSLLGSHIPYSFIDLLTIGIRKLVNLDLGHSKEGMICTAFCTMVYRDAMGSSSRFDLIRPDSCPGDLVGLMGKVKLEVRNAV